MSRPSYDITTKQQLLNNEIFKTRVFHKPSIYPPSSTIFRKTPFSPVNALSSQDLEKATPNNPSNGKNNDKANQHDDDSIDINFSNKKYGGDESDNDGDDDEEYYNNDYDYDEDKEDRNEETSTKKVSEISGQSDLSGYNNINNNNINNYRNNNKNYDYNTSKNLNGYLENIRNEKSSSSNIGKSFRKALDPVHIHLNQHFPQQQQENNKDFDEIIEKSNKIISYQNNSSSNQNSFNVTKELYGDANSNKSVIEARKDLLSEENFNSPAYNDENIFFNYYDYIFNNRHNKNYYNNNYNDDFEMSVYNLSHLFFHPSYNESYNYYYYNDTNDYICNNTCLPPFLIANYTHHQQQQHNQQPITPLNLNFLALSLLIFPIFTVFGNILVVTSVITDRALQTVTNYFIVSLAISDVMVAIFVMPLAVYVEVNNSIWMLGDVICDIWVALDVLCCTASILNLAAISVDRFFAVTQPIKYARHKNSRRVFLMLALTWIISAAISSPIVFGANYTDRRAQTLCTFYNSDFIIYSSMGSFYIPCLLMILLYGKIFTAIRTRARKNAAQKRPKIIQSSELSKVVNHLLLAHPPHCSSSVPVLKPVLNCVIIDNKNTREEMLPTLTVATNVNTCKTTTVLTPILSTTTSTANNAAQTDPDIVKTSVAQLFTNGIPTITSLDAPMYSDFKQTTEERGSGSGKKTNLESNSRLGEDDGSSCLESGGVGKASSEERSEDGGRVVAYEMTDDCRENYKKEKNSGTAAENSSESEEVRGKDEIQGRFQDENVKKSESFKCADKVPPAINTAAPIGQKMQHTQAITSLQKNSLQVFHPATCDNKTTFEVPPRTSELQNRKSMEMSAIQSFNFRFRKTKAQRKQLKVKKLQSAQRRERKATKTLAIVLGVFLFCWMPFFTINIINAVCIRYNLQSGACDLDPILFSFFVWLGYMNSFLNPVIYTIFNVEFRKAFKKLLKPLFKFRQ